MDIGTTVSAVRKEYKDYLREKHPEWAENTVKTHVSDAFYIWNNTLLPSFWKTLVDDESMEIGRQAIYSYLKNDLLSDTAEVRAKAYFADLSILYWPKSGILLKMVHSRPKKLPLVPTKKFGGFVLRDIVTKQLYLIVITERIVHTVPTQRCLKAIMI